jgi:GNAT superfamily N-acetyltransferase
MPSSSPCVSSIRSAQLSDARVISSLLGELGYPADHEQVRERLNRLLARDDGAVLVAEIAGAPAGVAAYQIIDLLERAAPQCRITTLVTHSDHRRRGVARALLEAIESAAVRRGCFRLEVTTQPQREHALRFYMAVGFHERPHRLVRALEH